MMEQWAMIMPSFPGNASISGAIVILISWIMASAGSSAKKARAIRFGTLEKLCEILDCQPGDLLAYEPAGKETRSRPPDPAAPAPSPPPALMPGPRNT
jgi:hypothetical protein